MAAVVEELAVVEALVEIEHYPMGRNFVVDESVAAVVAAELRDWQLDRIHSMDRAKLAVIVATGVEG